MFDKIRLENYRTHVSSEIHMGPITLLIGNNNAGKSNLLAGIHHFSRLVARARPQDSDSTDDETPQEGEEPFADRGSRSRNALEAGDFFPHRYRLAREEDPVSFSCSWHGLAGEAEYAVDLLQCPDAKNRVACRERIRFRLPGTEEWKAVQTGQEKPTERLMLRTKVEEAEEITTDEKGLCRRFFRDVAQAFSYHFQPSYLKGKGRMAVGGALPERFAIPSVLGYEGNRLQDILLRASDYDERAFQRFIAALRRFEPLFHGIRSNPARSQVVWEFDVREEPAGRLQEFPAHVVSDGLMKAAAVALLTTAYRPPALILIEEIENGINPGNISQFMGWLWEAAGLPDSDPRGHATQFILTSHSPSVLREFSEQLEAVYTVRLDRHRLRSDVRNLRDALDMLIGVGTVQGEIGEDQGKKAIRIPKYELTELWYKGTIG